MLMPNNESYSKFDSDEIKSEPKTESIVTWSASEFIAHHKTSGWYGVLGAVALTISGLLYLLTRDLITSIFVIFAAIILGYYGARKPKEQQYELSNKGVSIGGKQYSYGEFCSFSIVQEGAFMSIEFMPLKRFAPLRAIYFGPEQEDNIVNMLTSILPFEEHRHDLVDRLMDRIRF